MNGLTTGQTQKDKKDNISEILDGVGCLEEFNSHNIH